MQILLGFACSLPSLPKYPAHAKYASIGGTRKQSMICSASCLKEEQYDTRQIKMPEADGCFGWFDVHQIGRLHLCSQFNSRGIIMHNSTTVHHPNSGLKTPFNMTWLSKYPKAVTKSPSLREASQSPMQEAQEMLPPNALLSGEESHSLQPIHYPYYFLSRTPSRPVPLVPVEP